MFDYKLKIGFFKFKLDTMKLEVVAKCFDLNNLGRYKRLFAHS